MRTRISLFSPFDALGALETLQNQRKAILGIPRKGTQSLTFPHVVYVREIKYIKLTLHESSHLFHIGERSCVYRLSLV